MINVEQARELGKDLLRSGDPDRAVVMMTTPTRLALLNIALVDYIGHLERTGAAEQTAGHLRVLQGDVQKVVMQILQQEYPPA